MDIGRAIKQIRVGKNITQEKLAENILSRSHLSLIESNKNDISINSLLKLINKLHISADEFFYLASDYTLSESKSLSLKLMNESNRGNSINLKKLQEVATSKYKKTGDYEFYHLALLADIYIELLNNDFTLNEEIQEIAKPIKEYLFSLSEWYLYDLKLFNNILFVFDSLSINTISKKVMASIKKYDNHPNAREDYVNILINLSTYYIEKEAYEFSLEFAKESKKKTKNEYRIYENIILDINISISNIKLIIEVDKNVGILRNRLFVLESLGLIELSNHYKQLLKKHKIII